MAQLNQIMPPVPRKTRLAAPAFFWQEGERKLNCLIVSDPFMSDKRRSHMMLGGVIKKIMKSVVKIPDVVAAVKRFDRSPREALH